jgi:hypothetical protein
VTLLNAFQQEGLQSVRALAWTRPFTIKTYPVIDHDPTPTEFDAYADHDPDDIESTSAFGDWLWKAEQEGVATEGGPALQTKLTLNCSIDHQALLFAERARVVVDGIECAIQKVSSFPESGEIELEAVRAKT